MTGAPPGFTDRDAGNGHRSPDDRNENVTAADDALLFSPDGAAAIPVRPPTRTVPRTPATPLDADQRSEFEAERTPRRGKKRQQRKASKVRARKVHRIFRRLDPWSVLKLSFIFYLCVYVVGMVAGVLLWNLASGAGVVENVEGFIEEIGAFETFRFEPDLLLQGTAIGGAILVVLATGLTALGSVLFNLISDLVGGIRVTMLDEDSAVPVRPKRSGGRPKPSDTVSDPH